nr:MAG TPA: Beta-galactosidase [Bacteriophage sp.]
MSRACKCDRCNKFYERLDDNDAIAAISVKFVDTYNSSYYDLCPDCVKEFHEWFGKYGKEFNSL